VPECDVEVARKLLRVDVVVVVSSVRAKKRRSGGTTARPSGGTTVRPSGGDGRAHRRRGSGCVGAREWN
jgi:hypothetical protein